MKKCLKEMSFETMMNDSERHKEIFSELYLVAEKLGADCHLLSILGSYGDTLNTEEILFYLKEWNSNNSHNMA